MQHVCTNFAAESRTRQQTRKLHVMGGGRGCEACLGCLLALPTVCAARGRHSPPMRAAPWAAGPSNSLLNQTTNTLTRLGELYTDCVPPSAAEPEEPPAQAPAEIWAALCGGCTDAVRAKGGLAALSPERRQYCGERCGFWADARKHPRA